MAWTPSRVKRKEFEPTTFIFKGYSATNSTLLTPFINSSLLDSPKNIWSLRLSNIWPRRTSRPGRNSSHSAPFSCFDPSGTTSFSTFHPERRRDASPSVAIFGKLYSYFKWKIRLRRRRIKNKPLAGYRPTSSWFQGILTTAVLLLGPAYFSHGFESHHSLRVIWAESF